ncbi:hypothetical protein SLEP1_g28032 [Rubroshorea leprosula]|uniref:Major facilitator superfamily (MFS) profile domain-containing protein n=1 Tax=Rubroshorea leprosula TaxID=152421 RepID=A0AAV5JXW6_9ROSI|nr:hypothetical protein SLEP1_g28032 [Rubroshorea leprosula]
MHTTISLNVEGQQYNGRVTIIIVLSSFMVATGGFILGYDIGISGGVTSMTPFLNKFFPDVYKRMQEDTRVSNYCKFNSQLLTLFTSSMYLAGVIASFFASLVTKVFGRKPSILVGGVAFLTGSALQGAASNLYMLIFGRVLLGVGLGFTNQSIPLYISEMALPRHRGKTNVFFALGAVVGSLVANITNFGTEKINGGWGWRLSLSMTAVPAAILILCTLFLPETPNSLILSSKNHQKAKHVLERVRGTSDVQVEFDDLINASSASKATDNLLRKIGQRKYRPQLVMAVAIPFFQLMTGIDIISFYSPILFRTIGMGEAASLLFAFLIRLVSSIFIITMMFVVDKIGRRIIFMIGGTQMFLSLIALGAIFTALFGDYGGLAKGYAYLILVLVCLYVSGFYLSWGPLGFLVPSEIYPLEIRSAGQSITASVFSLLNFIIGQTFLAMLCHFKSGVFFFLAGWLAVMTAFVHFLLPETKKVPIEKMELVWREHWFWKRFAGEVDED